MSSAHVTLIIVGSIALAESTWGVSSPNRLREAVRTVSADIPERNLGLAGFFSALAVVMWMVMSSEKHASDWALLFLSWIFSGGALVSVVQGGCTSLMACLILRRPTWAIRLLYIAELIGASALIVIGVCGL